MKRRIICLLVAFALLAGMSVLAADDTGYLFETVDAITDETLLSRVSVLSESQHVYYTAFPAVLMELEAAGQLISWEEDIDIVMSGVETEISELDSGLWTDALLGESYAKEHGITGEGVRIGLIDSGVRSDFAELAGANVAEGTCYRLASDRTLRRTTDTDDTYGHGSFVATVIGSSEIGIAPGAELVPLKCFDGKTGAISCIVAAVYDAVDVYHVNILNMSLGTQYSAKADFQELYKAVRYAFRAGVIITAASGNITSGASSGDDPYYYPAAWNEVVGVGAVDAAKNVAQCSYQNDSVMVAAPGQRVPGYDCTGTSYVLGTGTSFATPYVTGAAALALSVDPTLMPLDFFDLLAETAEDLGESGCDHQFGYGLLNIGLLLAILEKDSESTVITGVSGDYSFSAYVPETKKGYQVMLAQYDEDGRFLSAEMVMNSTSRALRNLAVSEVSNDYTLFILENGTWRPIHSDIRY